MKRRIASTWLGFSIFMFLLCIAAIVTAVMMWEIKMTFSLAMAALVLLYLFFALRRKEDFFSTVTFTDEGISARYLGKEWFSARWDELSHAGQFRMRNTLFTVDWIYLSREPVVLDSDKFMAGSPCNLILGGKGLFFSLDAKSRPLVQKYLPELSIQQHGTITGNEIKPERKQ